MASFKCTKCGDTICYHKVDYGHRERLLWECDLCYLVLSAKPNRYERNAKGKRTVFIPMGTAFGDSIVQEVIHRRYLEENPDEEIIHLALPGPLQHINVKRDIVEKYNPHKLFWSSNVTKLKGQRPSDAFWFHMVSECNQFTKDGYYPRYNKELEPFKLDCGKYVIFHIRKMYSSPQKNVSPFMAMKIFTTLDEFREKGVFDSVVIIGNDDTEASDPYPSWVIDYRKKLSIPQIAWLCKGAELYVGKDSGLAHLAGTQGTEMVLWGFHDPMWHPKVAPGQATCFNYSRDVRMEMIQNAIRERLRK